MNGASKFKPKTRPCNFQKIEACLSGRGLKKQTRGSPKLKNLQVTVYYHTCRRKLCEKNILYFSFQIGLNNRHSLLNASAAQLIAFINARNRTCHFKHCGNMCIFFSHVYLILFFDLRKKMTRSSNGF